MEYAIAVKSLVLLPTHCALHSTDSLISVCHKTVLRMPLTTTVIGAWPKPEYFKLGDWFHTGPSEILKKGQGKKIFEWLGGPFQSFFDFS